jgi:hypothetical protein
MPQARGAGSSVRTGCIGTCRSTLFHFTPAALRLLFERAGFRVVQSHNVTPGEWLLMSMQAARNARRDVWHLDHFESRYGRRLLLSPVARTLDALGRGDAIVMQACVP